MPTQLSPPPGTPAPPRRLRRITIGRVSWMVAALALLVQAWPHINNVVQNQYKKGAAWEPRVDAILEVSRVASSGGPFLAIPSGSSFEPVDLAVNDLGFSAFGYFWGRLTGSPADRRVLMVLNLVLPLAGGPSRCFGLASDLNRARPYSDD